MIDDIQRQAMEQAEYYLATKRIKRDVRYDGFLTWSIVMASIILAIVMIWRG